MVLVWPVGRGVIPTEQAAPLVETASGSLYTDAMRTAEKVGFDGIWFFDALGRGTFRVDPISGMAAAAAVTDTIELGTCILQVPLRGTVELAHRILGIHYLSGGRIRLGVGTGSTEGDFKATGNDFSARFTIFLIGVHRLTK